MIYPVKGFAIRVTEEREKILKEFELLRWKDHYTLSEILMEAIKEYVEKHTPGNPQTPLDIYTSPGLPTDSQQIADKYTCPQHGRLDDCWRH